MLNVTPYTQYDAQRTKLTEPERTARERGQRGAGLSERLRVISIQSRYFHVDAPSSKRIRTDPSELGSKLRALTPILLPSFGRIGSQCVTQPHVLHLTNLKDLSPQEYSLVAPGARVIRTSATL